MEKESQDHLASRLPYALTGDWDELTIRRKHTRFGERRFTEALAHGIGKLDQYRQTEGRRIARLRSATLTDTEAYALLLRAYEADLLGHRVLRDCLKQWNDPGYDWGPPSPWRLYNAMTTPLQPRAVTNPQRFSHQTMKLMELVAQGGGDGAAPVPGPEARGCHPGH